MTDDDTKEVQAEQNKKTIDLDDEYSAMNVQTGYEHHSKYWYENLSQAEAKLEKEMKA